LSSRAGSKQERVVRGRLTDSGLVDQILRQCARGEVGERGQVGLGFARHLGDSRVARREGVGDMVELGADGAGGAHGEDRADPGGDHVGVGLGYLGEHD